MDKYMGNDEDGDKVGYLPAKKEMNLSDGNMINLDFEPDMSKSKYMPLSATAMLPGPPYGHVVPHPHQLGLPIPKVSRPMRRQSVAPSGSTIQRRMLFSPTRPTRMVISHKRKWFLLH